MRQPTEQPVHVDSTSSRSHGRARNRYGLAVSAPTGQIWTVLPEKYELNGSSGNVFTSVRRAAVHEVDQRVVGDLGREPGAAVAEDAALAVEVDGLGDRDRLLVVPLLLDPARLARAVGHGLVLQRALAALVAHRAVERVVGEQELEHAVLRLRHLRRTRCSTVMSGVHVDHAARLQRRAATGVDLDEAHPAHADRVHPRVVAEARDVGAVPLARVDEQLALLDGDLLAVDGDRRRGR